MTEFTNQADRQFVIPVDTRGRIVLPPEFRQRLGVPCRVKLEYADAKTARIRVVDPRIEAATSQDPNPDDNAVAETPTKAQDGSSR